MENSNDASEKVLVRRGRVDSVNLYEVKDNELDILENGEPDSVYLNFAIFLFSISISAICSLCTATFSSHLVQNSFLFISIIGVILGAFLLILWFKKRTSIKNVIKIIRDRIPPENKVNTIIEGNNVFISSTAITSLNTSNDPPLPQG